MIRTLRVICLSKCNLDCVYCCHEGYVTRSVHLSASKIASFCRYLQEHCGTNRVKLTGGEPLLCPDLTALVETLSREQRYQISLVSNGTLTRKIEDLVVRTNRNVQLTISLPALDARIYDEITRSTGQLPRVLETIELLVKQEFPLRLNVVLTSRNLGHVLSDPFLSFARFHRADLKFLQCVRNLTNEGLPHGMQLPLGDILSAMRQLGFSLQGETRSSCRLVGNGLGITVVKSFCYPDCRTCPEDKTSLWLAGDGLLRSCVLVNRPDYRLVKWEPSEYDEALEKLS